MNIIQSTAERAAAIEFGKAAAIRPKIVGEALRQIAGDPEVAATMFEILETQRIQAANTHIEIIPEGNALLVQLLAARSLPVEDKGGTK